MLAFSGDPYPQPACKTAPAPVDVTFVSALVLILLVLAGCQKHRPSSQTDPLASQDHAEPAVNSSADLVEGSSAAPELAPAASASQNSADPLVEEVRLPDLPQPPQERGAPKNTTEIQAVFDDYGFPVGPRMTPLCGRQEFLQDGETQSWDAFESPQPRAEVVEFYRSKLGERGLETLPNEVHWSLPAGSPAPTRRLTLADPGAAGAYLVCKPGAQASSKTILVMLRQ